MENRIFDLSKYKEYPFFNYMSLDEFYDVEPRHGISQILIGGHYLHALFIDRNQSTTLVHFGAALPRQGWDTYPNFLGIKSGRGLSANHLLLSDPNYALPGRLPTGWFAGSEFQDLQGNLGGIIKHYSGKGILGQVILFGSSAGGFASIHYGGNLKGSVSIAVNPRTDLRKSPTQYYRLAPHAFPHTRGEDLDHRISVSAGEHFNKSDAGTIAYIQNVQDTPYFEGNLLPFLEENNANRRVWLSLIDSGPGHVMPQGNLISDLFSRLVTSAPNWNEALSESGFANAPSAEFALRVRDKLTGQD